MPVPLPFAAGFYQSSSLPLSSQECVNYYVAIPQAEALSQAALFGRPGITLINTVGSKPNRGSIVMGTCGYHVQGEELYSQDATDTFTLIGTIPGQNPVSMATNGTKLAIVVPGASVWMYSTAGGLVQITDPDLPVVDTVSYKDGYFIYTDTSGLDWRVSSLNQPDVINALDFGSAEVDPDPIVASHATTNELYICGTETVQLFQNVGGTGFPFQTVLGASVPKGCIAKLSPVTVDTGFAFVGGGKNERPAIWFVSGAGYNKLSTPAIDNAIQDYTDTELKAATSWTYSRQGETFVGFNFRNTTFVYQVVASRLAGKPIWVEEGAGTGVTMSRSRITSVIKLNNELVVGDVKTAKIGKLEDGVFDDFGDRFRSTFSTRPFDANLQRFTVSMVEPTCESGVSASDTDYKIWLESSLDGKTWINHGARALGLQGKYEQRQIWRRLGQVQRFTCFRFHISDPCKRAILKLGAELV